MTSTLVIWVVAIVLEIVPPFRALAAKFLTRYKLFYAYLVFVLLRDLFLLGIYFLRPHLYPYAYWGSEPVSVLMGCGLVWEVYKIALAPYPGAARVGRNVLLFVFVFTTTRVFVKAWESPNWIPGTTAFEIERDLRIVQGALLVGLVAVFAYYAIPLGRNLNGIVGGYGLFLATSLINLTLRNDLGDAFQRQWQYLQPACYLVVLGVWCGTLWSYVPAPQPKLETRLEEDYQTLRTRTKTKLASLRDQMLKGGHS